MKLVTKWSNTSQYMDAATPKMHHISVVKQQNNDLCKLPEANFRLASG